MVELVCGRSGINSANSSSLHPIQVLRGGKVGDNLKDSEQDMCNFIDKQLDGVAPLIAEHSRCNSTNRQYEDKN